MMDPDESVIHSVCEFTNLDPVIDRELVVTALRAKGNNIEAIVAAFYDDEAKFRETYMWNETPFRGDRDGLGESDIHQFAMQGPDEATVIHGVSPSSVHAGAPSRPPSPIPSPLSRVADWACGDTQTIRTPPVIKDEEDTELQRALAESAAMSGLHTPQDVARSASAAAAGILAMTTTTTTAITDDTATSTSAATATASAALSHTDVDTTQQFFGPASRDAYEPDQWAMVRAAPEAQEASAGNRRRRPGQPAFLRSRRTDDNESCSLNAILTVLHAIPGARNALLRLGPAETTYGQSSAWWAGNAIAPVGAEATEATDAASVAARPAQYHVRTFVSELHRLMAFLDATDRAYGSADQLREVALVQELMRQQQQPGDNSGAARGGGHGDRPDIDSAVFGVLRQLEQYESRETATAAVQTFFSEVEVVGTPDVNHAVSGDEYALLDVAVTMGRYQASASSKSEVPRGSSLEAWVPRNLYNAIDGVYWAETTPGLASEPCAETKLAVVTRLAPVQILRLDLTEYMAAATALAALQPGLSAQPLLSPYTTQTTHLAPRPPFAVPAVFYADRYLAEHRHEALALQLRLAGIGRLIEAVDNARQGLLVHEDKTDHVMRDRMTLSEQAFSFALQKLWHLKAALLWERTQGNDDSSGMRDYSLTDVETVGPMTADEVAQFQAIQAELAVHRAKMVRIHRQLRRLRDERAALEELLRRLRLRDTEPRVSDGWTPKHGLHLRGVIVSASTFYLCQRDGDASDTDDQWWRISFEVHRPVPARVEKTTCEAALAAAWQETDRPVLVYATANALTEPLLPLSDALRTFVRFDNRLFEQELQQQQPAWHDAAVIDEGAGASAASTSSSPRDKKRQPENDEADPTSPSKRHQRRSSQAASSAWSLGAPRQSRAGSLDSLASNRASLGDEDGISDGERLMPDLETIDGVEGARENRPQLKGSWVRRTEMVQMGVPSVATVDPPVLADWDNPEGRYVG